MLQKIKIKTKDIIIIFTILLCSLSTGIALFDNTNIIRFLLLSIALVIVFVVLIIKQQKLVFPSHHIFYFELFFVLLYGLTIIYANNFAEAIFDFSKCLLALICCVIVFNLLKNNYIKTFQLLSCVAIVIAIVLLIAITIQFFALEDHSLINNKDVYAIKGLNEHKNLLSLMLFLLSPFLLIGFFIYRGWLKYTAVLLFVGCLLILLFLQTRATLLGLVLSLLFFCCLHFGQRFKLNKVFSRKKKLLTSFFLTVFILFFFLYPLKKIIQINIPSSGEKYSILRTSSLVERFTLWNKTYAMIDQSPFLGCGVGNWEIEYPKLSLDGLFRADYLHHQYFRPHNDFLLILAEGGWITFTCYLTFICFLIVFSFFQIIRLKNKLLFYMYAILLSAFVGFQVISFFDYPKERIELLIWSNILIASLLFLIKPISQKEKKIPFLLNVSCLLLFGFISLIGVYRLKGELLVSSMQRFVNNNNWQRIEEYSNKANSIFYNYTPTGFPIAFYQGQACARQNKPAIKYFKAALSVAPYHKQTLNELGKCEFFDEKNSTTAVQLLLKAIKISPNYAYPYFNLASIYLAEHKRNQALEILNRLDLQQKELSFSKNAVYYNLSDYYIRQFYDNLKIEIEIKNRLMN